MNLADHLERHAARMPEKIALVFKDHLYTYREFDEQSSRVTSVLRGLGVQRGDRVSIMLPNSPEWLFTFYGILKLGAMVVSINVLLKSEETRHILENSQSTALVVAAPLLPVVQAVRDRLPDLRHIIVAGGEATEGTLSYESLTRAASPELRAVQAAPDERCTIFYTSGTTGVPKGAVHTHEALIVQLEAMQSFYGMTEQDVTSCALPIFLLSVLIAGPLIGLYCGTTCYLMERFNVVDWVRHIKEWKVTMIPAGVPTMYYEVTRLPEEIAREVDFSSLRFAECGGAPIPAELRREFEEKYHFRFIHGYGMTEAPNLVSADPVDRERKFLSIGLPLPHILVKIVDDHDNELPTGQVGEICTGPYSEGPYAGVYKPLAEYWRMPEATAETLRGGFLHTGDLGYLDEDGFLFLVDRKKDMIIRGGNNVYPKELETVLYQDPRVQECAVVGVAHARLGEVSKAYIKLRPGIQATEQEFIDFIRERLAKFKVLDAVEFVDDFPRNAMGKILKRELRDQANAAATGTSQG